MEYSWQYKDFPDFRFDASQLMGIIQEFTLQIGEVNGLFQNLAQEEKEDLLIQITVSEAMKTSEIEGEYFSRVDLVSSIRMQLGLHQSLPKTKDKRAAAVARLMLKVRTDYTTPFSIDLIQSWHRILMEDDKNINAGSWRTGEEPMQIISGRYGSVQVHYEAPPSESVPFLMNEFEQWYTSFGYDHLGKIGQAMLRSALAHLYFETIHPFEDGNGRIGRAISEKALAESIDVPLYISLSKKIEENKNAYYEALKKSQRSLEVTEWLLYFFNIILDAEKEVKETVLFTVKKAKFFDRYKNLLNERQLKAIQKMMEYGPEGFEGGMTAKKYMSVNKTSKATATRDLQELAENGIFTREGGGRSVRYVLNVE